MMDNRIKTTSYPYYVDEENGFLFHRAVCMNTQSRCVGCRHRSEEPRTLSSHTILRRDPDHRLLLRRGQQDIGDIDECLLMTGRAGIVEKEEEEEEYMLSKANPAVNKTMFVVRSPTCMY